MMWRGHAAALTNYAVAVCDEWIHRGYNDSCRDKITSICVPSVLAVRPPRLGDSAFHASHRSNLLRKNPEHYGQFGWTEPSDLEYVWPVNNGGAS